MEWPFYGSRSLHQQSLQNYRWEWIKNWVCQWQILKKILCLKFDEAPGLYKLKLRKAKKKNIKNWTTLWLDLLSIKIRRQFGAHFKYSHAKKKKKDWKKNPLNYVVSWFSIQKARRQLKIYSEYSHTVF